MAADTTANPESSAPAETTTPPRKGSGKMMTIGIVGGVMIVEAVAIFLCMKMLGTNPDPTLGVEPAMSPTTNPWEEIREVEVAKLRVPNSMGTRTMLYNVRVVVRVHYEDYERVEEFFAGRKGTVEDAISRVVRSAEERHLAEPGLETLKRLVRHELNTLLGEDGLIEQVLIPECMPIPAGY